MGIGVVGVVCRLRSMAIEGVLSLIDDREEVGSVDNARLVGERLGVGVSERDLDIQ